MRSGKEISKDISSLGYTNYGYGAGAFTSEGHYYISPHGEGMPSKKGTRLTDSGKWIGAKLPVEVKNLILEYREVCRTVGT